MQPCQAAKRFYEEYDPDSKRLFALSTDTTEIQSLAEGMDPADPVIAVTRDEGEASAILGSIYLTLMRAEKLCNDSLRLYPMLASEEFMAMNLQNIADLKNEYFACQWLLSSDPQSGIARVWEQRQNFVLATLQFQNLELRIATLASMHIL